MLFAKNVMRKEKNLISISCKEERLFWEEEVYVQRKESVIWQAFASASI